MPTGGCQAEYTATAQVIFNKEFYNKYISSYFDCHSKPHKGKKRGNGKFLLWMFSYAE